MIVLIDIMWTASDLTLDRPWGQMAHVKSNKGEHVIWVRFETLILIMAHYIFPKVNLYPNGLSESEHERMVQTYCDLPQRD